MTLRPDIEPAQVYNAYGLYQREFVEELNLCPWAKGARERGQVDIQLIFTREENAVTSVVAQLQQWSLKEQVVVGLLLCPDFLGDRRSFERFVNRVVDADSARNAFESPTFALAAFHPAATPPSNPSANAEVWIPYLRRSPVPTIQAIRMSSLEQVRGAEPAGTEFVNLSEVDLASVLKQFQERRREKKPLRQRIAEANLATVERLGLSQCEVILQRARAELTATDRTCGTAKDCSASQRLTPTTHEVRKRS